MTKPLKRHYIHQVGWIGPPRTFDAVLNDFVRQSPQSIGVVQRVLHIPNFEYTLKERTANFHLIEEAVSCLAECGADVIAQAGCNWTHCSGYNLHEMREYRSKLEEIHKIRFHLEGLCLIDAMHSIGARKIAVNACYNNRCWFDGYVKLLVEDGFDIVYADNFVGQGFFDSETEMNAQSFIFPEQLASQSISSVVSEVSDVDAILLMGMPSWENGNNVTIRTHTLVDKLESEIKKPIVSGDIALFWAIFSSLEIAPTGMRGRLLSGLQSS